jgi:hypothetical protein
MAILGMAMALASMELTWVTKFEEKPREARSAPRLRGSWLSKYLV